jgi:hypothetical protein
MNFTKDFSILALGLLLSLAVGCTAQKGPQGPAGPAGGAKDAPTPTMGSSSGGGGFVDENSTIILKQAADGLAGMIQFSSHGIYKNLPLGMTQEKLADLIKNVRYLPFVERNRQGRSLMFDYGTDKEGEYIVALKPFFVAYSSFPVKFATDESLVNVIMDVRLKLAHEAAHHLGIGIQNDEDAESFA